MDATQAMTRHVTVVPPELSLAAAWEIMQRCRIRHLPVVRAGALFGILSDRDVMLRGTLDPTGKLEVPADPVATAMTITPISCEASTTVGELARIMIQEKIDAVPIVRGLRLVGLVTSTDLLALLVDTSVERRPMPFEFHLEEAAA